MTSNLGYRVTTAVALTGGVTGPAWARRYVGVIPMRTTLAACLLAASALTACMSEDDGVLPGDPDPTVQPGDPVPMTSGAFVGAYRVPVSADLTAAATYPVEHVDWTVAAGVATLHYDLPVGLVGGPLSVTFAGPISATSREVTLTSGSGSATCVATASVITCHEVFANLGVLPLSMAEVERMAALEYAGPIAHRVQVASQFSADPIGIVDFDLQAPFIDDVGDDHGGGR